MNPPDTAPDTPPADEGRALRLLFVCTENRLRSATAETVFCEQPGIEAIGAGTNRDAVAPVSGDLIEWADLVFCMEPMHRDRLVQRHSDLLRHKRLVVLGIADRYTYMQPELVGLLRSRVARHLGG